MISTFTAFIDANVFFGARLRSLLLFLSQIKMYRARWSERVHQEWVAAVAEKRGIEPEKLQRTRELMDRAVPDALVSGYEQLEEGIKLPDPDDRHVVAAATLTRADVIVTFNLDDFPADALKPLRLEARHPDEFLLDLFDISNELFVEAVRRDFEHYIQPKLTFADYVDGFRKADVPKTADLMEKLRILITAEAA
ncbi:PIN domain-containing protein [Mesorhizobium huakuii]|uniref:PIN domain-containing protein n=1 Tax=Mesorhizobium huakuii TaxID=28104 RepID=A0ABZ0VSR9_9HYPH|nr:PIN domain-containing protein [Mesorhizobium huakuii]WQC00548.1 PIN domain-containing protein [Mesorhizobium huakuii]